VFYIIAREE